MSELQPYSPATNEPVAPTTCSYRFITKNGKRYKIPIEPAERKEQFQYTNTNTARNWTGTYFPPEEKINTNGDTTSSSTTTGNEDDAEEIQLENPMRVDDSAILFFVGQWELPPSGRLHFHFVVCFNSPQRVTGARRILNHYHGYIEPVRSLEAAIQYCTKPETRVGTIYRLGNEPPGQGRSAGSLQIFNAALSGQSLTSLMDEYPNLFARHHTAISKICAYKDKPRYLHEAPEVLIYFGITGSGKSHKAYEENPGAYRKIMAGKWWDGYDAQQTVIFEEFDPGAKDEIQLPEILKILDKYPYRCEIKGGAVQLKANKFIFTTNINPLTWWPGHIQRAAFRRRVTNIYLFPEKFDPATMTEPKFHVCSME